MFPLTNCTVKDIDVLPMILCSCVGLTHVCFALYGEYILQSKLPEIVFFSMIDNDKRYSSLENKLDNRIEHIRKR